MNLLSTNYISHLFPPLAEKQTETIYILQKITNSAVVQNFPCMSLISQDNACIGPIAISCSWVNEFYEFHESPMCIFCCKFDCLIRLILMCLIVPADIFLKSMYSTFAQFSFLRASSRCFELARGSNSSTWKTRRIQLKGIKMGCSPSTWRTKWKQIKKK